ncbi:MAG: DMT family transporter [Acidobacteria bacterium]|nr:MAG: DMT family transporter [Acidobacteriota bacterium]REK01160.1 MAG: DMT family transporter [Acidobacteriota bacterium]REK14116.1 MAG: DMT family transporter [Acidobacteriota bacterium]REK44831.1 MAG: DMT family transporter [Acidobacteriota bacterium]
MQFLEQHENRLAPHIALFTVQIFFGSAAVLGKFALASFPSIAIVGFRVGGGALAFYLLQRMNGGMHLDKRSHYLYFALFAVFGIILNQLLFFHGLSLTTATNTSLLAVLIPVFAITISAMVGNDVLNWRKIVGIILAAGGVVYLIDPTNASFSSATTQGDILIILNSLSYAIYVAISKKLISHYGALKSIAWLFIFGSIVNVPVGAVSLYNVELSTVPVEGWLALAGVILFPTILAYYWNTWALARVEPSVVAVYVYLQPLIGTAAAIYILREPWNPRILLAMSLIFAGVWLVTKRKIPKEKALPAN